VKITAELLDRLDAEHKQLVQPRAFDKELRRLARIALESEQFSDREGLAAYKELERVAARLLVDTMDYGSTDMPMNWRTNDHTN
jgi:hypothetical protein